MTATSAPPQFRSAAHRRVVMQHIGATILPTAIGFAALAPLIGLSLIWGSTFVALICNAISSAGASFPSVLDQTVSAIVSGYAAAAMAAGISGVWVALLSPFSPESSRFYSGAAIIGMMNAFLFVSLDAGSATIFGGQLFLSLVGAVSAFLCAWLMQNVVLKRDELRRDRLAAERAERLAHERAKERSAAKPKR